MAQCASANHDLDPAHLIPPHRRSRSRLLAVIAVAAATVLAATPRAFAQTRSTRTTAQDDGIGADVIGAFTDSLKLLTLEHGLRIGFQAKTRRELSGPFWSDYRRSLRAPAQWEDRDAWWVNYLGHPIHGAAAGYIWLDNEKGAPSEISLDRGYWGSRGRAAAWAAGYSLQFEFGPLSEASIGNVGLQPDTTGWVDHVVTPVGAFGLIVAEDALDRFLVQWIEGRTRNRVARASLRLLFNPGRTLSNSISGHLPWYRQGRPLDWSP